CATVRDYIRAHRIFTPGPVILAVSGGADSTALLLILADLAAELGLVIHVAHFDHRTRPKESAEDADFVAKLANRVGAPIRGGRSSASVARRRSPSVATRGSGRAPTQRTGRSSSRAIGSASRSSPSSRRSTRGRATRSRASPTPRPRFRRKTTSPSATRSPGRAKRTPSGSAR